MELSMWDEDVPTALKMWANAVVSEAIKRGKLERPDTCSNCKNKRTDSVHAHHSDYFRPLDVTWLCASCHGEAHGWNRNPAALVLQERFRIAMENLSCAYAARKLGVSASTVRSWIAGVSRVQPEALETVEKLRLEYEQIERNEMAAKIKAERNEMAAKIKAWKTRCRQRGRKVRLST